MKKHAVAGLLLALALTPTSCGGSGGGDQGNMQGMDHGGSGGDARALQKAGQGADGGQMAGMDHGSVEGMNHGSMDMGSGGMASDMLVENGRYSDKAFIDSMVPHHEGAVEMAEVALDNAEHEEIKNLSEEIVSAQRAEIRLLGEIRERRFGSAEGDTEMGGEDMSMMGMMEAPQQLADEDPFDKAFIDAMIPHHESAIDMANVAYEKSDDPEIRALASDIVEAQEREIAQMEEWRAEWYPEG